METGVLGDPGENVLAPVEEEYSFPTVSVTVRCLRTEEGFAWVRESNTSPATQRSVHQMVITCQNSRWCKCNRSQEEGKGSLPRSRVES